MSLSAQYASSIGNKMVKVVVLTSPSCLCDYLGGRNLAQIQLELSLERNKFKTMPIIPRNETFESLLERLKRTERAMPNYCGPCVYVVRSDSPTLVENEGNALLNVMSCTAVSNPSIYCILNCINYIKIKSNRK